MKPTGVHVFITGFTALFVAQPESSASGMYTHLRWRIRA
jgi:hypothetical protein